MSNLDKVVYELVLGDTPYELSKEVTRRLNEGWELAGQPFLARNSGIFQAMVYYPQYEIDQRVETALKEITDYACAA